MNILKSLIDCLSLQIFDFFFDIIIFFWHGICQNKFIMLMYESFKVLEIKTSILFNLVFAINTVLSCFFSFS